MKILVVRFSSIGDIVLTSSVLRCLKQQIPHSTIHYFTKSIFTDLVYHNPNIDKVFGLTENWEEVIQQLKQENYDYVIDLHHNLRTKRLKIALKVPAFSFPKRNIKKFLFTKFKLNLLSRREHVVDRYFDAVKKLGVSNDFLPNEIFIDVSNQISLTNYELAPNQYIAVSVGAQFATKKMPLEIISKILNNIHFPIVLLGDKNDQKEANQIIANCNQKQIISLCGQLNLLQSAFVISKAKVALCHDTGLMHIAACFDIPIITVWGNTTPDFGMSSYTPINPNQAVNFEVENISCRPCSKIGYQKCPKKHFKCMNQQNTDAIIEELKKQIID